jgi:hypothetical protein
MAEAEAQRSWRFDADRSFSQQSGSGNNWQHGFGVHGPRCEAAILERVEAVRLRRCSPRAAARLGLLACP